MSTAVVHWLAENTPGSVRQLEGALTRVERLTAVLGHRVDVADLESAFDGEAERRSLSIDQIVTRVGEYYRVDPRASAPRVAAGKSSCRARSACTWRAN